MTGTNLPSAATFLTVMLTFAAAGPAAAQQPDCRSLPGFDEPPPPDADVPVLVSPDDDDSGYSVAKRVDAPASEVELHFVGVYQAKENNAITVRIERAEPMVLVLSSYEFVQWTIVLAPGSTVDRIVVSSYFGASVPAPPSIPVTILDRAERPRHTPIFAFGHDCGESTNTPEFIESMESFTGLPLRSFHGRYEATEFAFLDSTPCTNSPPIVQPRSTDPWLRLSGAVVETVLDGSATTDSDSPATGLTFSWSLLDGPDGVVIDSPNDPTTQVGFTQPGEYLFGLEVDDNALCRSTATGYVSLRVYDADETVIEEFPFIRGDSNWDGTVSISDAAMARRVFHDRFPVVCEDAADTNDDGDQNWLDRECLLSPLFGIRSASCVFEIGPLPEPYPLAGLDPTADGIRCVSDGGVAPPLTPPSEDARFVIEVGIGSEPRPGKEPGEEVVRLPVHATTPEETDGFSLALEFDAAHLEVVEVTMNETVYEEFDIDENSLGEPAFGFQSGTWRWRVEGSMLFLGVLNGNDLDRRLPPLDDRVIANIDFRILEDANAVDTVISPVNGRGDPPISNEFSVLGEAVYAVLRPGLIQPGGLPVDFDFIRGDANDDGILDIADVIRTLHFLFLGSEPLGCLDAADADDSGVVDISDPIFELGFLFLGTVTELPPPNICGLDPTADQLTCGPESCR